MQRRAAERIQTLTRGGLPALGSVRTARTARETVAASARARAQTVGMPADLSAAAFWAPIPRNAVRSAVATRSVARSTSIPCSESRAVSANESASTLRTPAARRLRSSPDVMPGSASRLGIRRVDRPALHAQGDEGSEHQGTRHGGTLGGGGGRGGPGNAQGGHGRFGTCRRRSPRSSLPSRVRRRPR